MRSRLALSVSAHSVRAVVVARDRIVWAGSAEWSELADLTEAVGRLAGDAGRASRTVRIVLGRDVVQSRTILPAPPLSESRVRRYVALEADRLFRRNGSPLVTDARIVRVDKTSRALWAAAAEESLLRALLDGCSEAGLRVDTIGPSADVALAALECPAVGELIFPNGGTSEVVSIGMGGAWRSRHVPGIREAPPQMHPALDVLGDERSHFAHAFAATRARPRFLLLPAAARADATRSSRKRLIRVAALALVLWVLAAAVHVGGLVANRRAATRDLTRLATEIDSALVLRRELHTASATLAGFAAAERSRSRHLALLARLSLALDDSVSLLVLRSDHAGALRLVVRGPSPARAVAALRRTPGMRDVQLEGRGESDRFTVVARWSSHD